ncbi:hypothetical protein BGY98DRAFT_958881 [Russula aff. rugulosa BPL654]|nr:hypothetical protein BGY98DRAFT_958881 [Russula aff. rugulosa BPL654]
MMTNNPSYVPIQHPQHNFMQNAQTVGSHDHEFWSNEHLPGIDSAGPYPAVNHADALSPTRYTSTMGDEDPPHVAIGFGQRQLDAGHPTPGEITQYIPINPGPPALEQYAPAIPEVPNNYPASNIPLPHNVAGPSRGDPSLGHSGMSVTENLKKNLASHYLHNPDSRVNDLRMRRSRSGAVKVLILLEIDDDM